MNIYTGEKFNKINDLKLYKFTFENEIHNGFQLKTGLNVDINEFNPNGICKKGGIYFCNSYQLNKWINYKRDLEYVKYIRDVEIPIDATVYIMYNKYKADKIILHPPRKIYDDIKLCLIAIKEDGLLLKYVSNDIITEELCIIAVNENINAIQYVPEKYITFDMITCLVKRNINLFSYIPKKYINIKFYKFAIHHNARTIQYVPSEIITEELCKIFIKENYKTIIFLDKKYITYELCKIAVNENYEIIKYIPHKFITSELCKLAVSKCINQLKYEFFN